VIPTAPGEIAVAGEPRRGEYVDIEGLRVFVDLDRYSPLMIDILRQGIYEGAERHMLRRLLAPGDRVIEIGSAIGVVGMVCASIVGPESVLCIEGNPDLVRDAEANHRANNLSITTKNAICKNELYWAGPRERADFFIARDFWASSLARSDQTVATASVPVLCFEREVREFRANVLICDIEGGENELLELANLDLIDKIILEVHFGIVGVAAVNRLVRKIVRDGFSIDLTSTAGQVASFYRGLAPDW